ncbi:hypothetical protein [Streptomyces sp. NPDC057199]|uniref:hypothetical protein n=1 Tax=Streptomyces sp. NPDC057199 TaxID=3346047 RepID=UPI0036353BD0
MVWQPRVRMPLGTREVSGMAIEWDRIGQPSFDRHVEALLFRMFNGRNGGVVAVNGRGGDGGIDVQVTDGTGLRIFQLKYYLDGFPGSLKSRRSAIKKSFTRAMRHEPVEWTLVVPCTLTPSERTFVNKLSNGLPVAVSVLDRSGLDDGFAEHADLEASFTRDQLREAARDFNQEQALLLGHNDLVERVRALGSRADNIDTDWTWDFARRGNTVMRTLRAKHPLAHESSPITVRVTGRTDAMSTDLTAAISRTLGFGIAEEVILPPEAVESLTIDGTAWLSETVTSPTLIWKPLPTGAAAGAPVEATFLDPSGAVAARYEGRLNSVGSGGLGASIDADIHRARLQMMLPFDSTAAATLRYTFDLEGREPGEAMKILRLHQRLLRGGDLRLTINGQHAGSGRLPSTGTAEDMRQVKRLLLYLADLDVVQRHCEAYFPAPLTYTAEERIDVRVARLLIEGQCVAYPYARTLTLTLSGQDDPAARRFLSDEPQGLRLSPPGFEITIGGRSLDIGPVHFFHTSLTIENCREAFAALLNGQGQGKKIVLRPDNGEHFRVFLAGSNDDGKPLAPTPLGLDGLTEPR